MDQQQLQSAQDSNKQPAELQYDHTDSINQRHDQRQTDQVYYQQDVRMKRHPELQPYVPSDRYTTATTTTTTAATTTLSNNNRGQAASRTLNNKHGNSRFATSASMTNPAGGNSAVSGQPKKYCSMTRLNQLAQPKKRPATNNTANNSDGSNTVNTATTLSTNSSNRSLNSISRSSEKVRQHQQQQQQQKHDRRQPDRSTVPQSAPRPQQKQQRADRLDQRSQQQKQQADIKRQQPTAQPNRSTVPQSAPRPQQQQATHKQEQQTPELQQQERRNSEHITPKLVVKSPLTPSSTPSTVVPNTTPQSSDRRPIAGVVHSGQPRDKVNNSTITSTPAVQLPTPASSLEEELQSAANNESSRLLNTTRDIVHDTSSLADQVAEISVNECFYQSAASDLLVPDSESTTSDANGIIDYNDRNPDSLCREFERDLIAKGIVSNDVGMNETFDNFTSPRATINNSSEYSNNVEESIRRNSAATIVTSEHSHSEKALQDEEEDDEDDRRIRAEKELREKARLEEEERKQREQLVENIMSRFSQGSQVS